MIIFDSNIRVIADAVSELDQVTHGQTIVIDDRNTVIYDSEQRWISTNLDNNPIVRLASGSEGRFHYKLDGRNYLCTYATSEVTGWKQIVLIPIDRLTEEAKSTRDITLLLVALLIGAALFLSIWLTLKLTRPMRDLMRTMKQVNKDNLDVQFPVKHSDEFGILAKQFNSMIRRIRNLVEEVYLTQNRKREAELRSLQHQINPHFIYNTLEVIRMTAEVKQDYEISDMTYNLGELLRYGIIRGTEAVTFDKEIEHLEQYVTLQNYRFSKDIQLEVTVRERHVNYRMIKLLFQPIVENAILHGFETKDDDCRIRMTSEEDSSYVYFMIEDNGSGMDEDTLKGIRATIQSHGEPSERSSIGIENVNERIRLHYGPQFGLRMESRIGTGTIVTIALPAVKEGREESI
jgi:two-component system sensor histidine kinase YesM